MKYPELSIYRASLLILLKVNILVAVFRDTNTPAPFIERFMDAESQRAALPDHIYMDHMGFGMGNSCLQLTFQACNVDEATLLYDQLANLCPIMVRDEFSLVTNVCLCPTDTFLVVK